ncbi:MAG: DUF4260 domain-containing protein [Bacteroidota bacterium]|jgi:Domain of unknown function (DUF4260)
MIKIIKLEELAMLSFAMYLFNGLGMSWWWFTAFLFVPDLSMIGYLANPKVGALLYNFIHHKALAIIVYLAGIYFKNTSLQFTGIILFAHSSMDRVMGYGLKYQDSFNNTHLGIIGKK